MSKTALFYGLIGLGYSLLFKTGSLYI